MSWRTEEARDRQWTPGPIDDAYLQCLDALNAEEGAHGLDPSRAQEPSAALHQAPSDAGPERVGQTTTCSVCPLCGGAQLHRVNTQAIDPQGNG